MNIKKMTTYRPGAKVHDMTFNQQMYKAFVRCIAALVVLCSFSAVSSFTGRGPDIDKWHSYDYVTTPSHK